MEHYTNFVRVASVHFFAGLDAGKLLHIDFSIYKTKVHCLSLEIAKHACNIVYFTHLSKKKSRRMARTHCRMVFECTGEVVSLGKFWLL